MDIKSLSQFVGATFALFVSSSSLGHAAVFTDTLEDIGTDGTTISSRTIGGVEVSLSTDGGFPFFAATYFDSFPTAFFGQGSNSNAPLVPANVSGTRFISSCNLEAGCNNNINGDFDTANPLIFSFSESVTSFGLTSIDLLEGALSGSSFITLSAFDDQNNLIDSQTRTGSQGASGLDLDWLVSSTSANIARVTFNGNVRGGYGIDDLIVGVEDEAESIPESSNVLGLFLFAGVSIFAGIKCQKKEDPKMEEEA